MSVLENQCVTHLLCMNLFHGNYSYTIHYIYITFGSFYTYFQDTEPGLLSGFRFPTQFEINICEVKAVQSFDLLFFKSSSWFLTKLFIFKQIYKENRERDQEETGKQSEERTRCCCSVSVPHCRLSVVPMGTRLKREISKPGVLHHRCSHSWVSHSSRATGSTTVILLPPRSAILSDSKGGAEVPDLAARELLLRGLLHE